MKWTKETAIKEIKQLVEEIEKPEKVRAFSSDHVHWHQRVVSFLEDIYGRDSRYF